MGYLERRSSITRMRSRPKFRQNVVPLYTASFAIGLVLLGAFFQLSQIPQIPASPKATPPPKMQRKKAPKKRPISLKSLAYSNEDLDFITPRLVSFYVPNDGEIIAPPQPESPWRKLLVEDDQGILKKVKRQVDEWDNDEFFAEFWNLEETQHIPTAHGG